ncbi:MAG TPA: LamG-like jellyroll fold domain-containing protein [Azospirillaceae bacterium]|nr:LamG-like jellyroll fold domain-containing protein [Azospirillaceae bacterium]
MAHSRTRRALAASGLLLASVVPAPAAHAAAEAPGLLFHVSADKGFDADTAKGGAVPLFLDMARIVPDGAKGGAIQADHDQILAWPAAGNIFAQRGTLSFFWRAREPLGRNQFPLFRVGYADHSSWDMVWLRLDWNGQGFDGFVTDANLSRIRVSHKLDRVPAPDRWTHIAFSWDETRGVRLYVDGKPAASLDKPAVLDAGLYAFGPHSRIIAPYQVQSRYSFMRGGDIDEIRIHDRMLDDRAVAELARGKEPTLDAAGPRRADQSPWREAWATRFGWEREAPPYLSSASTRIRKVEFTDARDVKQHMWRGTDGIRETTWPGVYNRSRLAGRHDYFELPDWNTYSVGGRSVTFNLPDEPWNRIELQGAAHGALVALDGQGAETRLADRPAGAERTTTNLPPRTGGRLRFDNAVQEVPIQEIGAYNVTEGAVPAGVAALSYTIRATAAPDYPTLGELRRFIDGRFVAEERATVVALPAGAPSTPRAAGTSGLPLVHVLIPADFRDVAPGQPVGRFSYGWQNMEAGLDGIALELPALKVQATHGGLVPLNIRVKDPIWPERDLLDVNVSVRPGEPRTLWLDIRDRFLPNDRSLYLQIASAAPDFSGDSLDGAKLRLVFKPREAAKAEHVADRFQQVRDNLGFFVEEQPNNHLLPIYERYWRDVSDLLRIDPAHVQGRAYWAEQNGEQPGVPFTQPTPPPGVPLWAFRQVEDLRSVQRFVTWWIDQRQIEPGKPGAGEFGGGISDDTDLLNQWPPLALMGVEPDKLNASLMALLEATYANGMLKDGLNSIRTDELHIYEEGINTVAQALYLNWGDPRTVERQMETARQFPRITEVNKAGHRHIVSNFFGADDIVREGVWEWSKPFSYLVLHPGLMLAEYNGSPAVRKLVLELADGYLAHGKQGPDGRWTFPAEINWSTDQERGGTGVSGANQIFWAAYRWTGDDKYLRPLLSDAGRPGWSAVSTLNSDVIELLGKRGEWGRALTDLARAAPAEDSPLSNTGGPGSDLAFARHVAWQTTGDKRFLEELYAKEIRINAQREYMMTEGHLWSDRVHVPSDLLQRARLGGMALRRNQIMPGHVVSWRFQAPARGDSVALLVSPATPRGFKVVAFNLEDRPVAATMTGWDVEAGTWRVTQGIDRDGDDEADGTPESRTVELERGGDLALTFPPKVATVLEFTLDRPAGPSWQRPDLGIGPYDVTQRPDGLAVTVHSLGAAPVRGGTVQALDAAGKVLASAPVPELAAPDDLLPKTTTVTLPLPAGARAATVRVDAGGPEITRRNNQVSLEKGTAP